MAIRTEAGEKTNRTLLGVLIALLGVFAALLPVFLATPWRPLSGAVERVDITPLPAKAADKEVVYIAPVGAALPKLLSRVDPRGSKCEGSAQVQIQINEQGRAFNPRVIRSLECDGADLQAIRAVMEWRFQPAVRNGQAVPASAWIEVPFSPSR